MIPRSTPRGGQLEQVQAILREHFDPAVLPPRVGATPGSCPPQAPTKKRKPGLSGCTPQGSSYRVAKLVQGIPPVTLEQRNCTLHCQTF